MNRLVATLTIAAVTLVALTGDALAQSKRRSGGSSNGSRFGSFSKGISKGSSRSGSSNGGSSRSSFSRGSNGGNSSSTSRSRSITGGFNSSNLRNRIGGNNGPSKVVPRNTSPKPSGNARSPFTPNAGSSNGRNLGSTERRFSGTLRDRILDRARNGGGINVTKPNTGNVKPPVTGNTRDIKPNTRIGDSIRDRIGSQLRDRLGDRLGKPNGNAGNGGIVAGGKGQNVLKPGGAVDRARNILIGRINNHQNDHRNWGLGGGKAKTKIGHGWGLCVKKHGHGFGFCYKPRVVYRNPYCRVKYIAGCDYTVACVPVEQVVVTTVGQQAVDAAIAAFRAGDYTAAGRAIEVALREMPNNPDVRMLHSLILFAIGDFENAAAAVHTALVASDGWDWAALSSFYGSTATYGIHLRILENNVLRNPENPALRFLLGYHYSVLGYGESAVTQLTEAVRMQPTDDVSAQLLELFKDEPAPAADTPAQPTQPTPVAPTQPLGGGLGALAGTTPGQTIRLEDVDLGQPNGQPNAPAGSPLTGTWTANPTSGLVITFTVTPDSRFTWSVNRNGQKTEFGGSMTLDGTTLTLTRTNDGEALTGTVTFNAGGFQFQSNAEGAPAITFTR